MTAGKKEPAPQPAAPQAPKSNVDPRLVQSLMRKGVLKPEPVAEPVQESQLQKAIAWATGQTK
jgi:hypothetical protein